MIIGVLKVFWTLKTIYPSQHHLGPIYACASPRKIWKVGTLEPMNFPVGRLFSFYNDPFSDDMLIFGGREYILLSLETVYSFYSTSKVLSR